MKLYLKEISEETQEFDFNEKDPWVQQALQKVDEIPYRNLNEERQIRVHFAANEVDQVIVLQGSIRAPIHMLCSRCATALLFNSKNRFSLLFSKNVDMTRQVHAHHHNNESSNPSDDEQTIDISILKEEFLDFSEIVEEQLRLGVPLQPLCKPECKGMCQHCGADLNVGRCVCKKDSSHHPFSVLKDIQFNKGNSDKRNSGG